MKETTNDLRGKLQHSFSKLIKDNNYTGICIIAPRVGKCKTVLNALIGTRESSTIVISVPRESIINTWKEEIIKWQSDITPKLLCNTSLFKVKEPVDLLVIDECQLLSPKQIQAIKDINPKRLLFITGTLNTDKEVLYKQVFKLTTLVNYPIDKAIEDGIIADFEINVVKSKLTTEEKTKYDVLTKTFTSYSEAAKSDRRYAMARNVAARKRMHFIYNTESKVKSVKEFIKTLDERYILFSANTKVSEELSDNRFDSKVKNKNLDKFISKEINDLGVIRMVDMGKRYALTS